MLLKNSLTVKVETGPLHSNSHTIYNDDCLNVMKNLFDGSIDLIVTDPPYNLGQFMKSRNVGVFRMRENHFVSSGWDDLEYAEWVNQMREFFTESYRVIKTKGSVIVFMSLMKLETIINLATEAGFYYKTVGIWHKTNPMPRNMEITFVNSTEAWVYFVKEGASGTFNNNEKMIHDHFETSLTPMSEKKHGKHPTQKPVKLLEKFIEILSNPNEVVLDPFMGSGSTAIASLNKGRKFIGSELDKKYFEIASKRIEEII
jgi:site-specific DNA-methyltransferase (adenine-specific)